MTFFEIEAVKEAEVGQRRSCWKKDRWRIQNGIAHTGWCVMKGTNRARDRIHIGCDPVRSELARPTRCAIGRAIRVRRVPASGQVRWSHVIEVLPEKNAIKHGWTGNWWKRRRRRWRRGAPDTWCRHWRRRWRWARRRRWCWRWSGIQHPTPARPQIAVEIVRDSNLIRAIRVHRVDLRGVIAVPKTAQGYLAAVLRPGRRTITNAIVR